MKKGFFILFILMIAASFSLPDTLKERIDRISKSEMQGVIEFLGDDLLEGRAPGTRGGYLSELYLKSLFKFLGLKPGINGKYMQPFKLYGFNIKALNLEGNGIRLNYLENVMGTVIGNVKNFELEGEAIFVGFGIKTDLWEWDDYKDVDVRDKYVVVRVNDPGLFKPNLFEGNVLTYFGRWKYKIEEAARRGASGILLIHTDESAGYSWRVVKNSWSGEELCLESDIKNNLLFRGWVREADLRRILESKKINLDKLYKKSLKRRFKPVSLGFKFKVRGKNRFREVTNSNVVAEIPGRSKRKIVISAHIDHLGIDKTRRGDNIFNGAIDNGSAVASMMVVAKILKQCQTDLFYTIAFLACNAEEAGLLGSRYYVQNCDRENIVANMNFESTPVWEKAEDFMGIGARFSTLEDMLKIIVEKEGLKYAYFSMSNQGFFYRSDQYSFARYNIPSMWISAGENDVSRQKKYTNFWKTHYHTVKDEYDPEWKLESMKQTIKITLLLIDYINKTRKEPKWKTKLTFPLEN